MKELEHRDNLRFATSLPQTILKTHKEDPSSVEFSLTHLHDNIHLGQRGFPS
jgi:hypothetical protein